ncbi:hypothetical protein SAMN02799624_05231 [Paenibacillus sp. UNC496MF]|uniref:hypothetical protein n=1 Tax=Paenibacillus sp. UNC496MF TaxID=1502753 RepID=UPI0008EB38DA|nr:hypothetical protein [Paenibacillus sp. UNC496MF]SFJ62574.1 hypothetical protein SAMN02799624_05231 [Paenibacillus sp. UNC496MF]
MRLQVTLREADTKLREHFEPINKGDQAYEARRLLLLGLEIDKAQRLQGNNRDIEKNNGTE